MADFGIEVRNGKFLLRTGESAYACGVNAAGYLVNLHWGGRIERIEDLPEADELHRQRHRAGFLAQATRQEYPGWSNDFYDEPALLVELADGTRQCALKYQNHEIQTAADRQDLIVTLADPDYPLQVRLHYRHYAAAEVLERWTEIVNAGPAPLVLRSAQSAAWRLPRRGRQAYRLTHLAGRWGAEGQISRQPVTQGKFVMESRTGLSTSFATPFFALDEGGADEAQGRVWFGTVEWSGNWKIAVERDGFEQVSVTGGLHDFDFAWPLGPGENFCTPVFVGGFTAGGFGAASRCLHRYQRRCLLPPVQADQVLPVIFNSWACLGVDLDEARILAAADRAAEVGAELFVIDDGWQAALGDWWADPQKFPRGLTPVIEQVRQRGMDFGLWVEIESFELKSRLYREHPDWAMRFAHREPQKKVRGDVNRTSYLLNFARPEVTEYFYQALSRLIRETGIKYLKLDMNCFVSDPGWPEAAPGTERTLWVKYVRNLHDLFARLNGEFPEVLLENCAAGGGRADLAMARCFGRINRSDNQDTLDVLQLHEGFTWLNLPKLAGGGCHISDAARGMNHRFNLPHKFMAYVGMTGSLSIGKNLPKCSPEELREFRAYTDLHKEIRHISHLGELYRLASHREEPYAAFASVSEDRREAVLFAFAHSIQMGYKVPNLRLPGLNPDWLYAITNLDAGPAGRSEQARRAMTGRALAELGIGVELLGDYDAKLLHFRAQ